MIASVLPLLALLQAAPEAGQAAPHVEPVMDFVCDYGEDRPVLPGPRSSRTDIYDLILGQELRKPDRARIDAALLQRFPGPATDAFLALTGAVPPDSLESIATFEKIVAAHADSPDPDLRLEAARARFMLIQAWRSRHVGTADDGGHLQVFETYRATPEGRRWSELLDAFLRDYRGKGAAYDEFVAAVDYDVLYRDAADRTPGRRFADDRMLDPEVRAIGAALRERLKPLIARYEGSPNERVQRIVARMIDMQARHDLGRSALVPIDRDIIARYEKARDWPLRASVEGAFERLKMSLEELGRKEEFAELSRRFEAWKAANPGPDCTPAPADWPWGEG